jgi:hypothetical protein
MADSYFPKSMIDPAAYSMEIVAGKLLYFQEQVKLIHWQTKSFAEHKALDQLYGFLLEFRDDVIEKLMGYTGRRIEMFNVLPLSATVNSTTVVTDLINFAYNLIEWAKNNHYCDVENLAQSLSGEAAKVKYLLTLK